MADTHVLSALKAKRGELAGRIDGLQDQLREAMIQIDHVDCTIRLFDPDIDLDEIKPKPLPPRHHAFKGQVTRAILTMLRNEGPMDAKAITIRLMAERDLNPNDKTLSKAMNKRIGAALRNLRERTLVASRKGEGGLLLWKTAAKINGTE
ncbi:hypothetical protein EKN06_08805 [Croceicoccus ponticola]|uniref:Uncharacterized protein n=1 Tax=Croceicoccus ponticola TaxID=2217664 RepID=A0A437GYZ9_9SPHN|nr:hypothetical protein [Croceicoccus ponticola]RVQ67026.1 hypothetical protein EKN06_08805 [Croceicoccus ponticola]